MVDEVYGDDTDGDESDEGFFVEPSSLTPFQKKQMRLREEMADIERSLVAEKRWDMKGEVKALQRPSNSLLEVDVEVEKASKPAPIITQEYTDTLEDMIVKRIVEQLFDDVLPKVSEEEDAAATDLPEVSQEKSKEGLGDVCDVSLFYATL
jgi:U3 small nucleolar RNA-associated protein MPP10